MQDLPHLLAVGPAHAGCGGSFYDLQEICRDSGKEKFVSRLKTTTSVHDWIHCQKRYDHRTKQMFLKWGRELTASSTAAARRGHELAFWASLRPAQLDFRLGQVVCLKQRLHLWAKSAAQPSPYQEICPSSREVISWELGTQLPNNFLNHK